MSPQRELMVARPRTFGVGDIVRVPIAEDAHDGGDAIVVVKRWEIIGRDSTHDVVTGHDLRTGFTAVDPTTDWIALKTGEDFIVERVANLARAETRAERIEREVDAAVRDWSHDRAVAEREHGEPLEAQATTDLLADLGSRIVQITERE